MNLRDRIITLSVLRDRQGTPLWVRCPLMPAAWRLQWAVMRIRRQGELGAMQGTIAAR